MSYLRIRELTVGPYDISLSWSYQELVNLVFMLCFFTLQMIIMSAIAVQVLLGEIDSKTCLWQMDACAQLATG